MADESMVTLTARISGRVQGVGFRAFVYTLARVYPICGWVRNLSDGSVEIVASGPAATIAQFQQAIKYGPRFGRVDSFDVQWFARGDLPDHFEIR